MTKPLNQHPPATIFPLLQCYTFRNFKERANSDSLMCNANSSFQMSVNKETENIPVPFLLWKMLLSQQELQRHRPFHCCTSQPKWDTREVGVAVRKNTLQDRYWCDSSLQEQQQNLPSVTHSLYPAPTALPLKVTKLPSFQDFFIGVEVSMANLNCGRPQSTLNIFVLTRQLKILHFFN